MSRPTKGEPWQPPPPCKNTLCWSCVERRANDVRTSDDFARMEQERERRVMRARYPDRPQAEIDREEAKLRAYREAHGLRPIRGKLKLN